MTTTQTPWPEGVIVRYLTVGGATVDLTHNDAETAATCTGCTISKSHDWTVTVYGTRSTWEAQSPYHADQKAREWAQSHAAKCRALPRPAVNA